MSKELNSTAPSVISTTFASKPVLSVGEWTGIALGIIAVLALFVALLAWLFGYDVVGKCRGSSREPEGNTSGETEHMMSKLTTENNLSGQEEQQNDQPDNLNNTPIRGTPVVVDEIVNEGPETNPMIFNSAGNIYNFGKQRGTERGAACTVKEEEASVNSSGGGTSEAMDWTTDGTRSDAGDGGVNPKVHVGKIVNRGGKNPMIFNSKGDTFNF